MTTQKRQPPKVPPRILGPKPPRRWLSVPMTTMMLEAVQRAARGRGINQTNFARLHILAQTDYNAEVDEDLPKLIGDRARWVVGPFESGPGASDRITARNWAAS